jgi:hypothetical protein
MEDYFGIRSRVDVKANSGSTAFMAMAPGVGLAFGTPTTTGGLNPASAILEQKPQGTHSDEDVCLSQLNSAGTAVDIITARVSQSTGLPSADIHGALDMNSQRITNVGTAVAAGDAMSLAATLGAFMPKIGGTFLGSVKHGDYVAEYFGTGDDSAIYYNGTNLVIDPDLVGSGVVVIGGDLTVNGDVSASEVEATSFKVEGTSGATEYHEFTDGDSNSHTVDLQGGIIVQWDISV